MRLLILLCNAALAAHAAETRAQTPVEQPRPAVDDDVANQLLGLKRVFVDRLSGGETAAQIRDMIISSLQSSRLFVVTENPERADAILKGSAEDLVYTDSHYSSDTISARSSFGRGNRTGGAGIGVTGDFQRGGAGIAQSEQTRSSERRHEATAAVRLVNKDGDVIWSTTQESLGGKFLGSSADVADRITKQLVSDVERVRRTVNRPAGSARP